MQFTTKIEPFLKTQDPFLLDFIMNMVRDYPGMPEQWATTLFERALESEQNADIILSNTKNFPLADDSIDILLNGLKRGGPSASYFKHSLYQINTESALEKRRELGPYLPDEMWKTFDFIVNAEDEHEMWEAYAEILAELDRGGNNILLHSRAKRMAEAMLERGWMDESEIKAVLTGNAEKDIQHTSWGMLASYMAAKLKLKEYIPLIAKLLASDDYSVQEEASDALIAYQSDDVIEAVVPYLHHKDAIIYAASVLANLKTDLSLKTLKEHYKLAGIEDKEFFFEALCHSLSPEALPEIQDFMENGPDGMVVEYELNLLGYHVMTGIPSPYVNTWRKILVEREQLFGEIERNKKEKSPQEARISEKIGRNDPCPCGSGKKYKKCCGM
ncbi:SEC-C metal-binding domain-containing protein [Bacillus sp. FJAT-27445]|uniref:SEC-C metal-binding domain-containing protein n=1 Tax=Bacillus sp. FJAT-27445 TaxID=1679166 RepID=UPI000743CDF8|nr:SEC-C metal-binding domain-containing protein [Bacillus sp. FJAT-27445]